MDELRGLTRERRWDYENAFFWFSDGVRLMKLLSLFELYKRIVGLPGDVVELGVFKGATLIKLATFRACLEPDAARRILGFDFFGPFRIAPDAPPADAAFVERFVAEAGQGLTAGELRGILDRKGFRDVTLIEGDATRTIPAHVSAFPDTRIAFMHCDLDVEAPTRVALDSLYDRIVSGGVVVFDNYGVAPGETLAADDFLRHRSLAMQRTTSGYRHHFVVKR
jgi:hypothetical protein